MPESQQPAASTTNTAHLTPELVRQVADRVYAMLLRDLQIGQERRRPMSGRPPVRSG
ncbi:MAG: hypothetical protein AB1791_23100 [Chloroflexota bacterium]